MDPADILTRYELAERLKTSPRWVFEMTRKRQRNPIPRYKIGRYLRFNWKEVCDWMQTTKAIGSSWRD